MDVLRLNPDDMSLGDIEEFEAYTGETIGALVDVETGRRQATAKMLTGMAFLALRQDDPDATIDDARRIKVSALQGLGNTVPTTAAPLEPLANGSRVRAVKRS